MDKANAATWIVGAIVPGLPANFSSPHRPVWMQQTNGDTIVIIQRHGMAIWWYHRYAMTAMRELPGYFSEPKPANTGRGWPSANTSIGAIDGSWDNQHPGRRLMRWKYSGRSSCRWCAAALSPAAMVIPLKSGLKMPPVLTMLDQDWSRLAPISGGPAVLSKCCCVPLHSMLGLSWHLFDLDEKCHLDAQPCSDSAAVTNSFILLTWRWSSYGSRFPRR